MDIIHEPNLSVKQLLDTPLRDLFAKMDVEKSQVYLERLTDSRDGTLAAAAVFLKGQHTQFFVDVVYAAIEELWKLYEKDTAKEPAN